MERIKITKRDSKFFIFGFLTMLIIAVIADWKKSSKKRIFSSEEDEEE